MANESDGVATEHEVSSHDEATPNAGAADAATAPEARGADATDPEADATGDAAHATQEQPTPSRDESPPELAALAAEESPPAPDAPGPLEVQPPARAAKPMTAEAPVEPAKRDEAELAVANAPAESTEREAGEAAIADASVASTKRDEAAEARAPIEPMGREAGDAAIADASVASTKRDGAAEARRPQLPKRDETAEAEAKVESTARDAAEPAMADASVASAERDEAAKVVEGAGTSEEQAAGGGAAAGDEASSGAALEPSGDGANEEARAAEDATEEDEGRGASRAETAAEPLPSPRIHDVEPSLVLADREVLIAVVGEGFEPGCSLCLGDEAVRSSRIDATRLEAVAPPRPPGAIDLTVTNPDGQSATLERALSVDAPPLVHAVSPPHGALDGGAEIAIAGRDLGAECVVLFGDVEATIVSATGTEKLVVIAPPHAAGAVDVVVRKPSGLSCRLEGAFVYRKAGPRIDSIAPAEGPSAGGQRVRIAGSGFSDESRVFVAGAVAVVASRSPEAIEIVAPAMPKGGFAEVRVVNPDGQADAAPRGYRYLEPAPVPVLAAVSPARGLLTGGEKVAVLGDDFAEDVVVRFGGTPAEVRFKSRKELEATAPARAEVGEVDVEVENPGGGVARLGAAFVYEALPPPVIRSVQPSSGPTTGGTVVVIEGERFSPDSWVYVGRELPKDVTVESASRIRIVTMPRRTAGVVDVEVGAKGAAKAVAKSAFRYEAVPPPAITSIAPNRGGVAGGTEITIAGKAFARNAVVLVGGKPVAKVKWIDATTLEVRTPPGRAGDMIDVAVRNPDGQEAIQKRAFLYDSRYD